jgi:hypothetical protein
VERIDLKKELKHLYRPSTREVVQVHDRIVNESWRPVNRAGPVGGNGIVFFNRIH